MSHKKELLSRAYIVLGGLSLFAILLLGGTMKIGVIDADVWREKGDSSKLKFIDIEPDRGNIFSEDGHLLATSVPLFDLHMDLQSEAMTDVIFDRHLDSLAYCLSTYVYSGQSTSSVKRKLIRRREAGDRYFLIKRNATYEDLTRIKKFPLIRLGKYTGGLIEERKSKRLKPFREIASRTIGLSRKNAQSIGLEGSFDDYLQGEAGKKLMQKVGNRVWVPVNDLSEIQPEKGKDIVTTLDMRIQDIAHTSLKNSLIEHGADFGAAVIMEVKTGAIKAMVNLDRGKNGSYWEAFNHAIGDATEPGSTFKLASMMALLEDGFIDIYDTVNINHGRAMFGRFKMKDAEWREWTNISIKHAFEISSNVGVAKLVDAKYGKTRKADQYIKRLKQFGLSQKTNIEILGEASPNIKEAYSKDWNTVMTLPWMSHGYELTIAPIQTLAFYNAVANGGKRMKPFVVKEVKSAGQVLKTFRPQVVKKRIASKETIETAKVLLEGVAQRMDRSASKNPRYAFAGKSGTTKLEYWKSDVGKYQASFVGYFPAKDPLYSCIVLVNNPTKNGYYGGSVAGKVFQEIADKCMATDVRLVASAIPNDELDIRSMPTFEAGYAADLQRVLNHIGLPYEDKSDAEWSILIPDGEGRLSLEDRKIKDKLVPNVKGMGLRDALFILENQGLKVKVNGYGKVRDQSVDPGTLNNGQNILLYLG